jgi:hypothetical protein
LFTNAANGQASKVFYRKDGMPDWADFGTNYPAGIHVNMALPFFRDSKLRVGGNGSVWESPMAETEFTCIINPWIEKSFYNCMTDTLYFDDHSILDHEGASWHWEISPSPAYINNADIRNPRVVLGSPGTYDVSLTANKNGQQYNRSIPAMVTTTTCPSIDDCNNPAELPKNEWSLVYVDSEELNYPGTAVMSFDGDPETIWHTRWSTGDDLYPHEIQVDLGRLYRIYSFTYLTRQDGGENGRIKEYELYISEDKLDWGEPVITGEFVNTSAPQTITLDVPAVGQYFRLVALSEVNGNPWASAAEFSMVGCTDIAFGLDSLEEQGSLAAFPVPTSSLVNISVPIGKDIRYSVVSATGKIISKGSIDQLNDSFSLDLSGEKPGIYIIRFIDEKGTVYTARAVKN